MLPLREHAARSVLGLRAYRQPEKLFNASGLYLASDLCSCSPQPAREDLSAGRRIGSAEEGLYIRLKFRVPIEFVPWTDDQMCDRRVDSNIIVCPIVGYCACIECNAKPFGKVIDKLSATTVKIARWDYVPVGT